MYQSLGFIQNQGVIQKLRRLYNRSSLEKNELNILRGMLSAIEKRLNLQKSKIDYHSQIGKLPRWRFIGMLYETNI